MPNDPLAGDLMQTGVSMLALAGKVSADTPMT